MTGCGKQLQENSKKHSSTFDTNVDEVTDAQEYNPEEDFVDSSFNEETTDVKENVIIDEPNTDITHEEEISSSPVLSKEENTIKQINSIEQEVNTLLQTEPSSTLKEKLVDKFITLVDFIYYDAPIGDVYFKDLTTSTQEKIRSILERMDQAIENKIPNYKDTLKEKYQTVLSYLKEKTNVVKEKMESAMGSENYENFKESAEDMKESFQNAGSKVTEGASSLYEKGKEKLSNWYQNLKENHEKES